MSGKLDELIAALPWTPHVHREGSRRHVLIWGGLAQGDKTTVVCWCGEPYCETNRSQLQELERLGFKPSLCYPPPKLLEALREQS